MDADVSKQILTKATPGYGVYNVNQRIWNAFGDQYGLHLDLLSRKTIARLSDCEAVQYPPVIFLACQYIEEHYRMPDPQSQRTDG